MKYTIAHIAVALPIKEPLDYAVPDHLQHKIMIGQRVFIPFRGIKKVGYVVGLSNETRFSDLKSVTSIIDHIPIFLPHMFKLAQQMAHTYGCSLGEAIDITLPKALRKGRGVATRPEVPKETTARPSQWLVFEKTPELRWPFLIKTIQNMLEKNRSALFIVPEASMLAPVQEFLEEHFSGNITVAQKLTEKNELDLWQEASSGKARLIIGLRSSIFLPMKNLGLIVVLHEENSSLKQEQMPCYHTRHIAQWRCEYEKIHLMFISRCPTVELLAQTRNKDVVLKELGKQIEYENRLVDLTNYDEKKSSIISVPLQQHVEKSFLAKKQFVLTVSRLNLVEIVKRRLAFLFPSANVAVYDQTTRRMPKRFDILIATPAILRESLVASFDEAAVLNIDNELQRLDYDAAHGAFVLLTHMRMMTKGAFWIQTRQRDHYVIQSLIKQDSAVFYDQDLKLREELGLPPYRYNMTLNLRSKDEELLRVEGEKLYWHLSEALPEDIDVFASQADNIVLVHDKFRYAIMVLGKETETIHQFVASKLKTFKKKRGLIIAHSVEF